MKIATVTCTKRPQMYKNIYDNILRQERVPDLVFIVRHNVPPVDGFISDGLQTLTGSPINSLSVGNNFRLPGLYRTGYDMAAESGVDLICTMDDDDWYGPGYISEAEMVFTKNPDAALLGKASYFVRWVDGRFPPRAQGCASYDSEGSCGSVAGPTICINAKMWRDNPAMRVDPNATWADVDIIIKGHLHGKVLDTGRDNFYLQRYPDSHGHGWLMPDPKE